MEEFSFRADVLEGTAATIVPDIDRKVAAVSLSQLRGTITTHDDPFFDVSSAVEEPQTLLGDLVGPKPR